MTSVQDRGSARWACALVAGLFASSAAAGWRGAACAWGAEDCNRCVPDVVTAVNELRDHGDVLGFFPVGDPVSRFGGHWQGIQRLTAGEGRYLAVSQSGSSRAFHLVEMGSRNTTGERFRSNRIDANVSYPSTPPSSSDRVVQEVWHGLGYQHAGGLQAAGNLLAVPLEEKGSGWPGQVLFYDVSTPWAPVSQRLPVTRSADTKDAGTASLAKLADGRFLLIIGRNDADVLEFYVSTGHPRDPATTFVSQDVWSDAEVQSTIGDWEFASYQNLNLITQCDGSLFLAGTHQNLAEQDWLDLFQLVLGDNGQVSIIKVAKKHLSCGYPSPGYDAGASRHCNLLAAGGLYVDPNGQLLVYGLEHDNDGPGGSVKMMEFRSIFPNPGCESDISRAFVELYDDSDFSDRGLMIDYPDEWEEDYSNLKRTEGFNDKASSVRYCIPPGWRYRLYKDTGYKGSTRDLAGRGSLNLNTVGFGDDMSSGRFLYVGY